MGKNAKWIGAGLAFMLFNMIFLLSSVISNATVLKTVRVATGLNMPTYVTASPLDREVLYVTEQHTGLIRIIRNGTLLPRPFLDIHDRVGNSGSEQGLLGLVFHPNYATNGYFYVDYTDLSGNTAISRFQVSADPDSVDPNSEFVLLPIAQPYANHNGGMLAFSPDDGYLYIGMGDGGSEGDPGNRAQNDGELLGKILRIDVNNGQPYGIPPSNPFIGMPGKRPEIWAKGMRNPWRFSFDRLSGDLYIGDVGQDLWEEVDFQPASSPGGGNYGWRLMEGLHCYNPPVDCDSGGLTLPIYEYGHNVGCAIAGGYVYRGRVMPRLTGTYFFGDYCSARIWSFSYDGANINNLTERTAELTPDSGLTIGSISSFGVDGYGEIYIVDINNGEIFKIVPRNPGSVTGTVTNDVGQAVQNAIVSLQNMAFQDTTDADGRYFFGGLGDGIYNIQFTHPGYADTTIENINVSEGNTTEVNITLLNTNESSPPPPQIFSFELFQNYPNPFNNMTNIEYDLERAAKVVIEIIDIRGEKIETLVNSINEIGHHRVTWDAANDPSGIYFCRMRAGGFNTSRRLLLLK